MQSNINRYDYFTESTVPDDQTQLNYPDVLSVDWNNGGMTMKPQSYRVSQADIDKWWYQFYKYYAILSYDDALLNANGVPYVGIVQPGSMLYLPTMADLSQWQTDAANGRTP